MLDSAESTGTSTAFEHEAGSMAALLALMGGAPPPPPRAPAATTFFSSTADPQGTKRKRTTSSPTAEQPRSPAWAVATSTLSHPERHAALPALSALCRRVFREQAFWKPADRAPANLFERLAEQIFERHAERAWRRRGGKGSIDLARSGAEWWVQVRGPRMKQGTSLGFHWDLDYARSLCPEVATVTYLTDVGGAPTVVLDGAASYGAMNSPAASTVGGSAMRGGGGDITLRQPVKRGLVSFPEVGKHISFRGDLLHGVPAELIACDGRPGAKKKKKKRKKKKKKKKKQQQQQQQQQTLEGGDDDELRITFLVNIWLNTGKLPEISEFDHTTFRREIEAASGAAAELALFDDVAFELFPRDKPAATTSSNSTSTSAATSTSTSASSSSSLFAVSKVRTVRRDTPVQGLYFGKEEKPFELWLPCPEVLREGSTELAFGGGARAECVVNRCW